MTHPSGPTQLLLIAYEFGTRHNSPPVEQKQTDVIGHVPAMEDYLWVVPEISFECPVISADILPLMSIDDIIDYFASNRGRIDPKRFFR